MTGTGIVQRSRGAAIATKVLIALLSQVLTGVMGIVAYRVVAATVDYRVAGLIFFAISLNGVIRGVFDLGVSRTVIREMAILGRPEHRQALMNHYLMLYLLASGLFFAGFALGVLTGFQGWFESQFEISAPDWLIALFFASGGVAILTSYMQSLMIGAKKINQVNYFESAFSFVLFGGLIVAVLIGASLSAIAVAFFVAFSVKMFLQILIAQRALGTGVLWPRLTRRVHLKTWNNFRFNAWISVSLLLHKQMDRIIAAIFLPIEQVGFYTIILMSLGRVSLLTQNIATVVFPEFSSKTALTEEAERRFTVIAAVNLVIMTPVYLVLFLLSADVGMLLVGDVGAEQAANLSLTIKVLTVYFALNMAFRLYRTLISSSRFVGRLALADAIGLVVSLPLVLWLTASYGLVGLALGLCSFFMVSGPITVAAAYHRLLTRHRVIGFVAQVLGVAAISVAVFWPITLLRDTYDWCLVGLTVGYVLGYLVYLVAMMVAFPPLRAIRRIIAKRI